MFFHLKVSHDKELIQELYESFSGFFSYNECARALSFNKDDIANAAQWLVDEGEKERTKKTVLVKNSTLLAQAEVVSDISNKNLKNNAEILAKEDSLIFPMNVSANIWTMNREQVTLYSETGIKIFSKNPKDVKALILKKTVSNSLPVDISEPVQKPNYLTNFNEDFFKRNRELAAESNELVDSLLEQEDFFLRYSRVLKPEKPEEDVLKSSSFISSIPPWAISLLNEPQKEIKEAILPQETLKKTISSKIPKKLILKGSHLKTVDGNKKGFHPHSNFHMCYDPFMKKYYVMNWTWNSYTNVFPSLITIAYDYENYEEKNFLVPFHGLRDLKGSAYFSSLGNSRFNSPNKGEIEESLQKKIEKSGEKEEIEEEKEEISLRKQKKFGDIQEAVDDLLVCLMKLQRRRFTMPWILNNWEYTYGYGLVEILNKKAIIASLKDIEPEKKKLNTQKNKLISRLNKFLAFKDSKSSIKSTQMKLLEIKKNYAGCIDGSSETFQLILDFCISDLSFLKDKFLTFNHKKLETLYLKLQYVLLWVKHSDILVAYNKKNPEIFEDFEKLCYEILKDPLLYQEEENTKKKILSLLWRILIQGFEIFIRETSRQRLWLYLIFDYSSLSNPNFKYSRKNENLESLNYEYSDFDEEDMSPLSYFYMKFVKWNESILPDYPLKESLIEGFKAEEEVKKVDSNTNFFNLYRKFKTLKLREKSFVEPFGRLFIEDLSFLYHLKTSNNLFEDFCPDFFIKAEENKENKDKNDEKKEENKVNLEEEKKKNEEIKENKEKIPIKIFLEKTPENSPTEYINIDGKSIKLSEFNPKIYISSQRLHDHYSNTTKLWSFFEEKLKKALETALVDGILLFRIFLNLFLEAWLEISRIEDGFFEAFYLTKLIRRFLEVFERVIEHGLKNLMQQTNTLYISKLLSSISLILNSVFPLIHHSNILKYSTLDSSLVDKLLSILEKLTKFTEVCTKNDQKLNILRDLFSISNEGIDQISEKIFETNHPYERGKVVSFDQYHFPGALAICVEFDKRCQSDTTNDYLIVAGWYSHHVTNMGLQMSQRDGLGTCYRISGKPNMKRPLVLLGNTMQVEFSSSGHAK